MWIRCSRLAAISIVFLAGCGGSDCKVEDVQYTKSVDAVGYVGATKDVTVARFELTQDFITHTPYAACADGPLQDVGNVSLTIKSVASQPVFLKYDVQGLNTSGVPVWSHADTLGVTLAPNQSLSVGQIATTAEPLDPGGARVLLQAANYVP